MAHPDDAGAPARPRILVVDDDRVFCSIVEEWLGQHYEVIVAHDGDEALKRAADAKPHLVLLDLMLPKLYGQSVGLIFRHDPRLRGVPIILMSGHAASIQIAVEATGEETPSVLKPFSLEYLSEFVRQHLPETFEDLGLEAPGTTPLERRASPRVTVSIPAKLVAPDLEIEGTILSLSFHGAYLQCDQILARDFVGALTFGCEGQRFASRCHVVYNALRDGHQGVGVRFFELGLDDEAVLTLILSGLLDSE